MMRNRARKAAKDLLEWQIRVDHLTVGKQEDPVSILKLRLAKGEVTKEQYEELLKEILRKPNSSQSENSQYRTSRQWSATCATNQAGPTAPRTTSHSLRFTHQEGLGISCLGLS